MTGVMDVENVPHATYEVMATNYGKQNLKTLTRK
tara:strand:- start:349 stop:450 length:102 start_codon:yes stop_codon:yes gene_type:complete